MIETFFVQDYIKNNLRNNVFYRIKKNVLALFGKEPKNKVNEFFTKDINKVDVFSDEYLTAVGYVLSLRDFFKDIIRDGTMEALAEVLKKVK